MNEFPDQTARKVYLITAAFLAVSGFAISTAFIFRPAKLIAIELLDLPRSHSTLAVEALPFLLAFLGVVFLAATIKVRRRTTAETPR